MDYRELLMKYVRHVAAAEGKEFARSVDMAPCDLGEHEYTAEEKAALAAIFQELASED